MGELTIGPLGSTVETVAAILLIGMTWFNAAELLTTIFFSFKRWTGKYFYCLVVATSGAFLFRLVLELGF